MAPEIIVYRDDPTTSVPSLEGKTVKFRLVYYGPVRPHKRGMDLALHIQQLRRQFHRQLCEFWKQNAALSTLNIEPSIFAGLVGRHDKAYVEDVKRILGEKVAGAKFPLADTMQKVYSSKCSNSNGYVWLPLVLKSYDVNCELDIVMLFARSSPGPMQYGDIDNRKKTLIDALRQPDPQRIVGSPSAGETPFFVLMEDDSLVTRLTVETDSLYRPNSARYRRDPNDRLVHVTITVTLRPYNVTTWNLMFA